MFCVTNSTPTGAVDTGNKITGVVRFDTGFIWRLWFMLASPDSVQL